MNESNGASRVATGARALVGDEVVPRNEGVRCPLRWVLPIAAWLVAVGGCVYDGDDRCSPGQVSFGPGLCTCVAGAVPDRVGCVACGENEAPGAGGTECVCNAGFSRPAPGLACAAAPSALGAACDTSGTACADASYGVCIAADEGAGYCTRACASGDACEGGYACDTSAAMPYCRRPPTGAGEPCEIDADCAGTEATFCESFVLHQCVVQGCSAAAADCFAGTQCCEQLAPVPLCLPNGAC